jgi:type IV pilus assembly protein PilC
MSNNKKLSASELSMFSGQLALTVRTGISVSESIMILKEDAETPEAEKLFGEILSKVELGQSLASSLEETKVFPPYMIQMIEIGEASGRLDNVLSSLENYYKREENLSKSIRSAVTYPSIMLCILVAVIMVLVIKVLPIFNDVFESLGGQMSPLASGAMSIGNAISNSSVVLIIIVAAIALVLFMMRFLEGGRATMRKIGYGIFKKTSSKMESGKFASGMALMLASGVDINKAVDLATSLITDTRMSDKTSELKKIMDQGGSFTDGVKETGIFTGMQARMLTLGFKSGNLDEVMETIADNYEEDVDNRLDRLISIIEPTMVAVLCVIVGLILLSAMLPLLGVMTSLV